MSDEITYSFENNTYFWNLGKLKSKYLKKDLGKTGHFFLIADNWDDFNYKTKFDVYFYEKETEHISSFGDMKIMKLAVSYKDKKWTSEYLKEDGIFGKVIKISDDALKNNNYISITSETFRNKIRANDKEISKDLSSEILQNFQDVIYDSNYSKNKKLNKSDIYKNSLLRDNENYSLIYLNRFEVLKIRDEYLERIKKLKDEFNSLVNNYDDLVVKSLILTALIQIENYLKDLINLRTELDLRHDIIKTNGLIQVSLSFVQNYIERKKNDWNDLKDIFKKLYKIGIEGIDGIKELHPLRNKLAHNLNGALIVKNSSDEICIKSEKDDCRKVDSIF